MSNRDPVARFDVIFDAEGSSSGKFRNDIMVHLDVDIDAMLWKQTSGFPGCLKTWMPATSAGMTGPIPRVRNPAAGR